jgi:Ulp1 family protease
MSVRKRLTRKKSVKKNSVLNDILNDIEDNDIIFNRLSCEIRGRDLRSVRPGQWLTDEVVNFFMHYLCHNFDGVFAFRTQFYTKFSAQGYQGVRRWTRNFNLSEYRIVLVPICENNHFTLGFIDFTKKIILHLDSLKKE